MPEIGVKLQLIRADVVCDQAFSSESGVEQASCGKGMDKQKKRKLTQTGIFLCPRLGKLSCLGVQLLLSAFSLLNGIFYSSDLV